VITHSCWALAYITSEEQALDDLCDPETGGSVTFALEKCDISMTGLHGACTASSANSGSSGSMLPRFYSTQLVVKLAVELGTLTCSSSVPSTNAVDMSNHR
jgi:hypothetical protein